MQSLMQDDRTDCANWKVKVLDDGGRQHKREIESVLVFVIAMLLAPSEERI